MRTTFNIPDDLASFLKSEAEKNLRTYQQEVVWRLRESAICLSASKVINEHQKSSEVISEHLDASTSISQTNSTVEAADCMDDSGDIARANSPAQLRRKAQIEALQRRWSELFPKQPPLHAENAKAWLVRTNNSARQVEAAIEKCSKRQPPIEWPISYINASLGVPKGQSVAPSKSKRKPFVDETGNWVTEPTQEELDEYEWAKKAWESEG